MRQIQGIKASVNILQELLATDVGSTSKIVYFTGMAGHNRRFVFFQWVFILTLLLSVPFARLRICPLGDSITSGEDAAPSYRRDLYRMLDSAGYEVDFVGSMDKPYGGFNPADDFDPDHEGHWGWMASEIHADLALWLSGYTPDVVLLHVGTNNLWETDENNRAVISNIVNSVRADNSAVVVFLAQIIPLAHGNDRVVAYNELIASIGGELSTPASPVLVVDHYTGFDTVNELSDGVHPTAEGYRRMAKVWFAAIDGYYRCSGVRSPAEPLRRSPCVVPPGSLLSLAGRRVGVPTAGGMRVGGRSPFPKTMITVK